MGKDPDPPTAGAANAPDAGGPQARLARLEEERARYL